MKKDEVVAKVFDFYENAEEVKREIKFSDLSPEVQALIERGEKAGKLGKELEIYRATFSGILDLWEAYKGIKDGYQDPANALKWWASYIEDADRRIKAIPSAPVVNERKEVFIRPTPWPQDMGDVSETPVKDPICFRVPESGYPAEPPKPQPVIGLDREKVENYLRHCSFDGMHTDAWRFRDVLQDKIKAGHFNLPASPLEPVCQGCGSTKADCEQAPLKGAIKCCPDCDGMRFVLAHAGYCQSPGKPCNCVCIELECPKCHGKAPPEPPKETCPECRSEKLRGDGRHGECDFHLTCCPVCDHGKAPKPTVEDRP
jgi:hypothetical protein